jgi:hypothetical protein
VNARLEATKIYYANVCSIKNFGTCNRYTP